MDKEQAQKLFFWAPAPLSVKSWADVDDEDDDDYYATTAPPPVWGVAVGKDAKVAPVEVSGFCVFCNIGFVVYVKCG